jgi:hypothetical protein
MMIQMIQVREDIYTKHYTTEHTYKYIHHDA